jgi:hypothetical protein
LQIVPILFGVFVLVGFSALVRLAAKIFRGTVISWKACFLYVFFLVLLSGIVAGLGKSGMLGDVSPFVILPIGVIAHFCYGTWFFSKFSKTKAGDVVNPIAAAKLTGVFLSLLFAFCLLLAGIGALGSNFQS